MTKKISYMAAGLCAVLLLFAGLPSCATREVNDMAGNVISATYRISGRVVDEHRKAIKGIRVEMQPGKGVALDNAAADAAKGNVADTDGDGRFEVEVLSGNVKGDILVLEFTDPADRYESETREQQIDNVKFTGGEGLYYLGSYATSLKEYVVMLPKGKRGEDAGEAAE